jgi:hypothetical protein
VESCYPETMSKVVIAVIVVVLVVIGLMVYGMRGLSSSSCEVCMEYNGQTKCRSAKGPNKMDAIRTASDNACAYLASGMTESMSCGRTTPKSTKCE